MEAPQAGDGQSAGAGIGCGESAGRVCPRNGEEDKSEESAPDDAPGAAQWNKPRDVARSDHGSILKLKLGCEKLWAVYVGGG